MFSSSSEELPLECWLLVFDFIRPNEEFPLATVCSDWRDHFVSKRKRRGAHQWITAIARMVNTILRLQWAHKHGCPCNGKLWISIGRYAPLDVAKWAGAKVLTLWMTGEKPMVGDLMENATL
jgi:hypothetical protein